MQQTQGGPKVSRDMAITIRSGYGRVDGKSPLRHGEVGLCLECESIMPRHRLWFVEGKGVLCAQ